MFIVPNLIDHDEMSQPKPWVKQPPRQSGLVILSYWLLSVFCVWVGWHVSYGKPYNSWWVHRRRRPHYFFSTTWNLYGPLPWQDFRQLFSWDVSIGCPFNSISTIDPTIDNGLHCCEFTKRGMCTNSACSQDCMLLVKVSYIFCCDEERVIRLTLPLKNNLEATVNFLTAIWAKNQTNTYRSQWIQQYDWWKFRYIFLIHLSVCLILFHLFLRHTFSLRILAMGHCITHWI